ncbi:MAG: hypothetical protein K2X93_13715 [Candidatus Obscuribacterales bacterium]|nr:hypothetical protein [Candidatus Obscuribacterales bacterium]
MVIEIPRSILIREPWTTMSTGGNTNTRPLVATLTDEEGQSNDLKDRMETAPTGTNIFRVVDGVGPCYEFSGTALMKNDLLTVHVLSDLKFLR